MHEEVFRSQESRETVLAAESIAAPVEAMTGVSAQPTSSGIGVWLRDLLETLILAVIIFLVINTITGRYEVQSIKYGTTLHEGQY
jgi:large-conductance mechanosensitive channel